MKPGTKLAGAVLFGAAIGGTAVYLNAGNRGPKAYAQMLPTHHLPQAKDGGVVVQLCDGKTSTEIKGLKPGEQMSHAQAVGVSRTLMAHGSANIRTSTG
jgi:hypothetical protein